MCVHCNGPILRSEIESGCLEAHPVLFLRPTAEARSTAMGSFRIKELRRAGKYCIRGAQGRASNGGGCSCVTGSRGVREDMDWGETFHVVGGVRDRSSRGTKYVTGRLGGQWWWECESNSLKVWTGIAVEQQNPGKSSVLFSSRDKKNPR